MAAYETETASVTRTKGTKRRALVTASTGGIGLRTAQLLQSRGLEVIMHGRDCRRSHQAAQALGMAAIHGDLSDPGDIERLTREAVELSIDVLVNAAGPYAEHDQGSVTADDWESIYRSNVISAMELTKAVVPGMHERGFGRVVFLGTRATRTPIPTMIEYSAAKAALANAMISLARSVARPGVTVNMVSPGVILTPGVQEMFEAREEYAGKPWSEIEAEVTASYAPNPMGRLGRVDDVAAVVAFLCSDAAGYVNGADIPVDGGITGTH